MAHHFRYINLYLILFTVCFIIPIYSYGYVYVKMYVVVYDRSVAVKDIGYSLSNNSELLRNQSNISVITDLR